MEKWDITLLQSSNLQRFVQCKIGFGTNCQAEFEALLCLKPVLLNLMQWLNQKQVYTFALKMSYIFLVSLYPVLWTHILPNMFRQLIFTTILTLDSHVSCGIHCWCRWVNSWPAGVLPSMGCAQRIEWEGEGGSWASGSLSPHCDVIAIGHCSAINEVQQLNSW